MKTTLTMSISYDPAKTDPKTLAETMDRLLEPAWAATGVLNEPGSPLLGKFEAHEGEPLFITEDDRVELGFAMKNRGPAGIWDKVKAALAKLPPLKGW